MSADARVEPVAEIATEPLFDMVVDLDPPLDLGDGRILFGAAGGSFTGPRLRGEVLAGGGDWTWFRPGGAMTLDVRLTLRTHDGALLLMTYGGRRAGDYFRTTPVFQTGSADYAWLNDVVCVGSGYLVDGGVAYGVSLVR
ncbi:DUF3237 domain-containing protein [Amycolatopsis sp. NPDC088138]|uniref:DUF3237 domain-containing protein n=1 Tax=Amycolatopsis sp. NPDC088138 TaxID=3363938 RepID=UPI00382AD30D